MHRWLINNARQPNLSFAFPLSVIDTRRPIEINSCIYNKFISFPAMLTVSKFPLGCNYNSLLLSLIKGLAAAP